MMKHESLKRQVRIEVKYIKREILFDMAQLGLGMMMFWIFMSILAKDGYALGPALLAGTIVFKTVPLIKHLRRYRLLIAATEFLNDK